MLDEERTRGSGEIRFRWSTNGVFTPVGERYRAGSVIAVGFVPRGTSNVEWPPKGYRRHIWRPAFRALFRSGNSRPPERLSFVDGDIGRLLVSRDFRALVWTRGVQLSPRRRGDGSVIETTIGHGVGFTRLPGDMYFPGIGVCTPQVREAVSEVELSVTFRFKLGRLTNALGTLLTGYRAPSAWIRFTYFFGRDLTYDVCFEGSHIPSQHYYFNGRLVGEHDMLANEPGTVSGFVRAGDCSDSPKRRYPEVVPHLDLELK